MMMSIADRELHRHVAVLSGARDLRGPRLPALLRNERAAEMIYHDLEGGQALRHVQHGFELCGIDRNGVEHERRCSELRE
jgi:hypothetical protein